jgi:hypothetical protein
MYNFTLTNTVQRVSLLLKLEVLWERQPNTGSVPTIC